MRTLALALALLAPVAALAVPTKLNHQGVIRDASGVPLEGAHEIAFHIYDQPAGGSPLWSESISAQLEAGAFSVVLGGSTETLDADLFDGSVRYLGLAVDGEAEMPQRIAIVSVPYATRANEAGHAATADALTSPVSWDHLVDVPDDADSLAALACATGEVPTFDGVDWTCGSPTPASVDVTTLSGTIDVDNLPVGTSGGTVAAGDHTHGFGQITGQAAITQLPTGTTGGTVALGDHGHTITDLSGDLPLTRTTGDLPLTRTSGDLDAARLTGTVAFARLPTGTTSTSVAVGNHTHTLTSLSGDLPFNRVSGDLDVSRLTGVMNLSLLPTGTSSSTVALGNHTHTLTSLSGDLPLTRTTGNLDVSRLSGNLPLTQTSGNLDVARLSGTVPIGQLPTGTTGTTVALGNHSHSAADVGALPIGGGTLTGGLTGTSGRFTQGVVVGDPGGSACGSSSAGLIRWSGGALQVCNGSTWVSYAATGTTLGSSPANAGQHCQAILNANSSAPTGTYWIDPDGNGGWEPFEAWCDMTTNGGGWTLVMNVAPTDGNSVGYNNQAFWTGNQPYGHYEGRFGNDYKSAAAFLLAGDYLMIQSADVYTGTVLGWRRWPMTSRRTFDSFFGTGIVGVHATDSCETQAGDAQNIGSTSSWDDIIRQGTCLYADVNPSASGEGDTIRLTTISNNSTDNRMSGFASCIDCGASWQGWNDTYLGMDRAPCNSSGCAYNGICRMPGSDCRGAYCNGTYATGSCGTLWNSRFYVR